MLVRGKILLLIFLFFILFPVVSQETGQSNNPVDFYLVSIMETAFSGELRWRPDWPADIPPDGFMFPKGSALEIIELSNEEQKFTVKKGSDGCLVHFPFFTENGCLQVEVSYTETGALQNISILIENYTWQDGDAEDTSEEKKWIITFPDNFLPYSELSPGGSFAPITASCDDLDFYIFIFESPGFLTETWYDSEGNMLAFCKALINREKNWFIRSLQIHNESGFSFIDYYFDSNGNVSEIRFPGRAFSAQYTNSCPLYWQTPEFQYALQWDSNGFLRAVRAAGLEEKIEYRYEYEGDTGDWIKRQETAYFVNSNLLVPNPAYSRGTWNRRVLFFD
jgi:hypothetical protein